MSKYFLALVCLFISFRAEAAELIMFEEPGCMWCERWKAEVGDAYPLSEEGKIAPLRTTRADQPLPEDVTINRPIIYTPTFVVIEEGMEVSRIEGYPGEDFFWPMLKQILDDMGK